MIDERIAYIRKVASFFVFASEEVAAFIGCQFALESNFGESDLANRANNHCGMKSPQVRFSYDRSRIYSRSSSFAKYESLYACLADYSLWLAYNRFTNLELRYLQQFKDKLYNCKYCPEPDYISKIEKIYNEFINYKN